MKIKVMKGNWSELRTRRENKLIELTKEEFSDLIKEQVANCKYLLTDIKSIYNVSAIKSIDLQLSDETFQRMIDLNNTETRHPIITFHGTSTKALKKIFQEGYRAPGVNGGTMVHGAIYGPGVYTSHFINKAKNYNKENKDIIINIVFLGKVKLIGNRITTDEIVNGTYSDGVNTRVVFGLEQVVSADPKRVVPIGIVTLQ